MDNPTRSETTRKKAIKAAFVILSKEGVKGLTFDALTRESGISKGGLLHQFKTKDGVLKALLDYQSQEFDRLAQTYLAGAGEEKTEKTLAKQIVTYKAASRQSHSAARALFAAIVENPDLLHETREFYAANLKRMQEEAEDPDLALLRYFAASGMVFNILLELSPLPKIVRERLFNRLMDDEAWQAVEQKDAAPAARSASPKKRASRQ
jgi:AcrR family transcriptional regulator